VTLNLRLLAIADRLLSRERGASAQEIADATGKTIWFARDLVHRLQAAGVRLVRIESRHARRGFVYRLADGPMLAEHARKALQEVTA
jgi:hypothetical protein